jgi:hypothetical protein
MDILTLARRMVTSFADRPDLGHWPAAPIAYEREPFDTDRRIRIGAVWAR